LTDQPLLEVIDDFAPPELFEESCRVGSAKGWSFGQASQRGDGARFWNFDLERIVVFDSIWEHARARCQRLTGAPLRVIRQYANGHTYGLGGRPHIDDVRTGCYTLLYYPMAEWRDEWDGETVFYDERGEIALSVRPLPNRAVLFDSRILHAGRAPSRACEGLRVTVAFKLETIVSPEAAPEKVLSPVVDPVDVSDGRRIVRVSGVRVAALVQEQLANLGATLRLPGFRPGKIPFEVLERRYGDRARAETLKRLASDAAASMPEGTIVSAIEIAEDPMQSGDVELRLTVIHLPDLPEPEVAGLVLDRLTASASDMEAYGVTADALAAHLKQQMLNHLDATYTFTVGAGLVEREFASLWEVAQSQGLATREDAVELRGIAERRVRLGIVVTELARRFGITGAGLEDLVLDRLISKAEFRERPATPEELGELA